MNFLNLAVANEDYAEIERLAKGSEYILELDEGINAFDNMAYTPLMTAVATQKGAKMLNFLIDLGADPNLGKQSFPLELAVKRKYIYDVVLLLQRGADPNIGYTLLGKIRWVPLDIIADQLDHTYSFREQHKNVGTTQGSMIEWIIMMNLLLQKGADPYLMDIGLIQHEATKKLIFSAYWSIVKEKFFPVVIALSHLSANELMHILDEMWPGVENISHYRKWQFIVTIKHFQ